jgi:mannose-6-phosphate isomerase-like protein (cupin superfamily)
MKAGDDSDCSDLVVRGCFNISVYPRGRNHMGIEKVNLASGLAAIPEHWRPHIIGEVNGSKIQLAKFQGDFVWHSHEDSEDVFLVLKGRLEIDLRDQTIELEEGELLVVPRGAEHRPRADEEVHVLNIELTGTVNTGDAADAGQLTAPEQHLARSGA